MSLYVPVLGVVNSDTVKIAGEKPLHGLTIRNEY